MAWSAGHTLLFLLALLLGLGGGWLLWGRQPAGAAAPGGEEAGATEVSPVPPVAVAPTTESSTVEQVPTGPVVEPVALTPPAESSQETSADPPTGTAVLDLPEPAAIEDEPPASATLAPALGEQPVAPDAAVLDAADEPEPEPVPAAAPVAPAEPVAPVAADGPVAQVEPVAVPEPVAAGGSGEGAGDDLRRIEGIGPKMAAALNAAGIRTYQQLAELDEAELRSTVRGAGMRAVASLPTWPQQARVLAGGGVPAAALGGEPAGS